MLRDGGGSAGKCKKSATLAFHFVIDNAIALCYNLRRSKGKRVYHSKTAGNGRTC